MGDTWQAARDALRQRFQDLATAFRQNHAAWQEAVRVGSLSRQGVLIARERAILTEIREVMTAFQATIAPRYQERDAAGESPRERPAQGRC